VDLGWHLGELVLQGDLDVEGCGRDRKLERHAVLRVRRRLLVQQRVWVHLAQLVHLNVRVSRVHSVLATAAAMLLLLLAC